MMNSELHVIDKKNKQKHMKKTKLIEFQHLKEIEPKHKQVNGLDLVIIKYENKVSVFMDVAFTEVL